MITILKAKENNLQNIDVNIPDHKLVVVTGVSGSGKSTLVYDVIFQEARRRYLESFSANARQFLGKLNRPDVQYIAGLSPAIALEQKQIVNSPRSTVGTLTELYDLLRLLFARIGTSADNKVEINRSLFSFNALKGACENCKGLGVEDWIDPELLIDDDSKSIREGAFGMTTPSGYIVYSQVTMDVLNEVCEAEGFTVDIPWKDLSQEQKHIVLFGSKKLKVPFGKHTLESRMKWSGITAKPREEDYYKGIIPVMEEILKRDRNPNVLRFARTKPCETCHGSRLNKKAESVFISNKNISELAAIPINVLINYFENHCFATKEKNIAEPIVKEILKTAKLIQKLGLGFLHLGRSSDSLSGGETQRLRLAKLAASGMRGILYIFDEPSVGLHPKETANLMEVLFTLRDNENTVLIVEHNELVIKNSDWVIDMGPGAGNHGGRVLFNGPVKEFFAQKEYGNSATLKYLNESIDFKEEINSLKQYLNITGVQTNNLKNINASFVLQGLNVITGLSGAGKTSLIDLTLSRFFQQKFTKSKELPGTFKEITGHESIQRLLIIDQNPIGKTPRSNPATYTGLSDELRNLFASLEDAKARGLKQNHFSFNTKGGRCEKCEGAGYEQIGMQMLGTVEVVCSQCNGKQFKPDILEIKYRGKSIADIYALTINEAFEFFTETKIQNYLQVLKDVGLGYLTLNQRSSTLSGGEARRVKLAKNLVKVSKQATLFIIDEPSSGLHTYDIFVLLKNLNKLIDQGHTIILVEQNSVFIKNADHLIELGPASGALGGEIVFQGNPKDIMQIKNSQTAKALNGEFNQLHRPQTPVLEQFKPIQLKGIETHNLKGIDVEIPLNNLTVVAGISGSGKSSLAFDTLFAEGRQRYAESFSAYVRNRLNINSQAKFESIKGLMPTVAVDQKNTSTSERSTVGTMTDIYNLLRLLFARVGKSEQTQEKPMASLFSFNHEQGACPKCQGLGYETVCDESKLVSDASKSLLDGALDGSKQGKFYGDVYGQYVAMLKAVGEKYEINYTLPYSHLSVKAKQLAMLGTDEEIFSANWEFKRKTREGNHEFKGTWIGFLNLVNDEYQRKANDKRADAILPIMKHVVCESCKGTRLNKKALSYKVLDKNISEWSETSITELLVCLRKNVLAQHSFSESDIEQKAAQLIVGSALKGLDILNHLGLGYLSLARKAKTLSGGESQRVRLGSAIGKELSGVCLVLDEPTAGLHSKDITSLMYMLQELKRQGNTIVVCEHDPEFMVQADHIIEIGPGAGAFGGQQIALGSVNEIVNNADSITGKFLKKDYQYHRQKQNKQSTKFVSIKGACANNLKNIDVELPNNALVVFSGVSGSGKSSLMHEVVYQSAMQNKAVACDSIAGFENFDQIIYAEQKLPKAHALSFVASYLGFYDELKNEFVAESKALSLDLKKSHFSLNGKDGRCEKCMGKGQLKTALDFLADVYETCDECQGQRFKPEVLIPTLKNKNIAEILDLSFSNVSEFIGKPKVKEMADLACQLGLGYLRISQNLNTLSGGELQRLKLLKSLMENKGKPSLFLLDEPTTGLHMQDVEHLMVAFDKLLEKGHSLMVIEHHKTVVENADYLLELGPEGGEKGGNVVSAS
ncbi:MAG: ATP-binding cassette domain-containing protein [Salinivirgaceae bacterium]|nr:ATP-binding cassette domain-containing protein [Salinivirgaceae bacterium]